jgi:hypothetical protein
MVEGGWTKSKASHPRKETDNGRSGRRSVNWFQSMSAYIVTDFILRLPLIGLTLILVMFPVASPPAVWITESWFPDSTLRLRRR